MTDPALAETLRALLAQYQQAFDAATSINVVHPDFDAETRRLRGFEIAAQQRLWHFFLSHAAQIAEALAPAWCPSCPDDEIVVRSDQRGRCGQCGRLHRRQHVDEVEDAPAWYWVPDDSETSPRVKALAPAPLPGDLARLLAEINNAMQQWDICRHRVRAASGEWRDLGAVLVDCRSLISRVEATEQQYRDWLDNVPGHPCGCGQEVNGHGVIIATHHACEAHKALAAKVEALEQERDGLSFNLDAAVDALAKWQAKRADARAR
jgi:hypothetical protein